jgi:hypothetical protein
VRRRRVIIILAAAVLVAIGAVAYWSGEPRYHGKTLSEWLVVYEFGRLGSLTFSQAQKHAEVAISHMGTSALPWLVNWIQYEEQRLPWWKNQALIIACKLHIKGSHVWTVANGRAIYIPGKSMLWIVNDSASRRADYAYRYGFKLVGPQAAVALPDLLRLSQSTNSVVSARARYAMVTIPNLLPQLVEMLTNATSSVRFGAVCGLNSFGSLAQQYPGLDTARAVPSLVQTLKDPDLRVRKEATNALQKIAPDVLKDF